MVYWIKSSVERPLVSECIGEGAGRTAVVVRTTSKKLPKLIPSGETSRGKQEIGLNICINHIQAEMRLQCHVV